MRIGSGKTVYRRTGAGVDLTKGIASIPLVIALCGCTPPANRQHFMVQSDPERGRRLIADVGCGACHSIPGIDWPRGTVGPPLNGFADQALIAGRVANQPENLTLFVRNAPAVVPQSAMPAMPLTPQESRDVAAYLYTLKS